MGGYSFYSLWIVKAPIERVWDVISKPEEYPTWWMHVVSTLKLKEGDPEGVGTYVRSRWTTALPYSFEFETEAMRVEKPHLLEVAARGELDGTGLWELSADGELTTIRYYWRVQPSQPWMQRVGPVARPAFAWNHAVVMQSGGEDLARYLGAEIVHNESFTAESANPLRPVVAIAGMATLAFLPVVMLRHRGRRK